jgi:hypothetical protein
MQNLNCDKIPVNLEGGYKNGKRLWKGGGRERERKRKRIDQWAKG